MTETPLLSVCIPTYNRAAFLKATLASLTGQAVFQQTNQVEIVVSDNCSDDETSSVIAAFKEQFPNKITALRSETCVNATVNFVRSLEGARGRLRKLHNDTLVVHTEELEKIVDFVRRHEAGRPFLFFLNGRSIKATREEQTACRDLDAFVRHVSYYSTWIGAFALWDSDLPVYAPLFHRAAHCFIQTEILFLAGGGGREVIVYNPEFGQTLEAPRNLQKKQLEHIYFAEYTTLLRREASDRHIQEQTLRREIRRFCFMYYIPWYYRLTGCAFISTFPADFRFLRHTVSTARYYTVCLFYLAFCLARPLVWRHRKLAWKLWRLF